jgi:hypothetical protein
VGQDLNELASARRAAAAKVSRDFATVEDLDTLLSVAERGFSELFDGGTTIELSVELDTVLVDSYGSMSRGDLDEVVLAGLAGSANPDVVNERPGILLAPQSTSSGCRAWIQFATPRRVSVDEMIVADLFAQAFALAVDRVVGLELAARREEQLRKATESRALIGQAVGILVERHRLLPGDAFERLRAASQHRNIKLREIAERVIQTGMEPECA